MARDDRGRVNPAGAWRHGDDGLARIDPARRAALVGAKYRCRRDVALSRPRAVAKLARAEQGEGERQPPGSRLLAAKRLLRVVRLAHDAARAVGIHAHATRDDVHAKVRAPRYALAFEYLVEEVLAHYFRDSSDASHVTPRKCG